MGWSTEVFDAHETTFTIFTDFGPRSPLAPDRLRLMCDIMTIKMSAKIYSPRSLSLHKVKELNEPNKTKEAKESCGRWWK